MRPVVNKEQTYVKIKQEGYKMTEQSIAFTEERIKNHKDRSVASLVKYRNQQVSQVKKAMPKRSIDDGMPAFLVNYIIKLNPNKEHVITVIDMLERLWHQPGMWTQKGLQINQIIWAGVCQVTQQTISNMLKRFVKDGIMRITDGRSIAGAKSKSYQFVGEMPEFIQRQLVDGLVEHVKENKILTGRATKAKVKAAFKFANILFSLGVNADQARTIVKKTSGSVIKLSRKVMNERLDSYLSFAQKRNIPNPALGFHYAR